MNGQRMIGTFILLMVIGLFGVTGTAHAREASGSGAVMGFEGDHAPTWFLKGTRPLLIGGYGDNFNYDGSRVVPLIGKAMVAHDTASNSGTAFIKLSGTINPEKGITYTGDIRIYYTVMKSKVPFQEGSVADFVYIHGDTRQAPPVMPKSRAFLASWGTADIYVNGTRVYEGLDAHVMYTERSRDKKTRAIYNRDRSGFYSPKDPADGSIANPDEKELHFVAHSTKKDTGNFPPHTVWVHLNFERVKDKSRGGR